MESPQKVNATLEGITGEVQRGQQSDEHPSSAAWANDEGKDDVQSLHLKGRPTYATKTGTWKASVFICALALGDWQASIGVALNLVPFLYSIYSLSLAEASTATTNFVGTSFALTILGGFVADSYLGAYFTVVLGGLVMTTGLALLTIISSKHSLEWRPPACPLTVAPKPCSPAGNRYMIPLYVALYLIALGTGLVRPTLAALAAEQFDMSVPSERKQIYKFFIWFYFFLNIGLVIAFTLGVYLTDYVSRGWGYAFSLMLYASCFAFFLLGTRRIRRKPAAGSFLTRMVQVCVASIRKWRSRIPVEATELYDPAPTNKGLSRTIHTNKLRCLDRAAIIEEEEREAVASGFRRPNPWRLCSVTQVEESKRLLQLLPICLPVSVITLVFSQLATFTLEQGMTMNRHIGTFDIPAASLGTFMILTAFLTVPIYAKIVLPLLKRCTGSSYGMTPLMRMGLSLIFATLCMITGGLVERKRLTYVNELHLEKLPLGPHSAVPMSFWWLLPQLMLAAEVEFFFYISAYEFFFHESPAETRTIATSFVFLCAATGYFMSSFLVDIINKVTSYEKNGSWLLYANPIPGSITKGQLTTGGISKFYYFLAVFIFGAFLLFLVFAYFYEYKHDWYGQGSSSTLQEVAAPAEGSMDSKPLPISSPETETTVAENGAQNPFQLPSPQRDTTSILHTVD